MLGNLHLKRVQNLLLSEISTNAGKGRLETNDNFMADFV